jgi:hypothetical protein
LKKLQDDIIEYYGALNEVKAGARGAGKLPPKPDAMILYEKCKSTGLPLRAGGLLDQPHIWLLEWEVVDNTVKAMERLSEAQNNDNKH